MYPELSGITDPTTVPMVADCVKPGHLLQTNRDIDPRHNGMAVVGFADGHVALIDPAKVRIGK
jgi:prepilin-type processing-associated H-X9-DG protein